MRRLFALIVTALVGLVVLPATPALAGGPTSVLIVNYDGTRASGALTGSAEYDALITALDAQTPPSGETITPDELMARPVRLTWMIHDVQPWRVDVLTIDGPDVWVSTQLTTSGQDLFSSPLVRHRPADTGLLLATLTELGILDADAGATASSGARSASDAGSPAAAAARTSPQASTQTPAQGEPGSGITVPPLTLVGGVAVALALGAAVGRSTRRPPAGRTDPALPAVGRPLSPADTLDAADGPRAGTRAGEPSGIRHRQETLKRFTLR